MATVPGDPNEPTNVTPMMPKWAQPTMADFLQAAAIMDQRGAFKVADATQPPIVQAPATQQQDKDQPPKYEPGAKAGWYQNPERGINMYYDDSGHPWLRKPGTH